MNIIILESRLDIRILLSIGYSHREVSTIFVLIGGLIGLIGGVLTILFSILLVTAILSFLASAGLPYVLFNLETSQLILIILILQPHTNTNIMCFLTCSL